MPDLFLVLFIISVLPILLSAISAYFRITELGKLDNHRPREQQAALTGTGARAVAAQKNAWEALLFFATVTLIAVASPIDLHSLSIPAFAFLAARIAHPLAYIANWAVLRSMVFTVGWLSCVYIFLATYNAY